MEEALQNSNIAGLPPDIALHLNGFGIKQLRPEQSETIKSIGEAKDCLVVTPTGSGKSLSYITYSLMNEGLVVVISPLIALIKDQVKILADQKIIAATLHSNMLEDEKRKNFILVEHNKTNLLFVSPERFNQDRFRAWVSKKDIKLIVIDEAHCVSQWGYGFRPDYRKLGHHISKFENTTKLALTATATHKSVKDIIWHLGLNSPTIIRRSPIKENTQIAINKCLSVNEQHTRILDTIANFPDESGVVFCTTINDALKLRDALKKDHIENVLFHGRMESAQKQIAYKKMRSDSRKVIVATKAFGLGVNLQNLEFAIHKGVPDNIEGYLQEIGRIGRSTKKTVSSVVYTNRDIAIRKFMNEKSYPDVSVIEACIHFLANQPENRVAVGRRDFEDFYRQAVDLTEKKMKKSLTETLEFFRREQLIRLCYDDSGIEYIELSDSIEDFESFLTEYKVRKKINQQQFRDVMSFLQNKDPVRFLREYYE